MAAGGHFEKVQTTVCLKCIIRLTLCMHTDHTLPSDTIMSVHAYDKRLDKGGQLHLADVRYKEKERKDRFGEIHEKITREEYILDWSQSKMLNVKMLNAESLRVQCTVQ